MRKRDRSFSSWTCPMFRPLAGLVTHGKTEELNSAPGYFGRFTSI